MTGAAFVDANVLVYARDASEPEKQRMASTWMAQLWQGRTGRVSIQVLHEFYVTVTTKLKPGMARDAARQEIQNLAAWRPLPMDFALLARAWTVQDHHRVAFWDALIVAAAQTARCRYLLSEDLQDGQQMGDVTVVNPFRHEFASLS